MTEKRFTRSEVSIKYREIRHSEKGSELRWMVTQECFLDNKTGRTITRGLVRHPGICVIVPFTKDGGILLMRQYRFAVDEDLWELPAGTMEGREEDSRMVAIESAADSASRELHEETGWVAGRIEKAGECYAIPGSGDELINVFFAFDLVQKEQMLEEGEIISEVVEFSLAQIEEMIDRGQIRDAKTLVALFLALRKKRNAN